MTGRGGANDEEGRKKREEGREVGDDGEEGCEFMFIRVCSWL